MKPFLLKVFLFLLPVNLAIVAVELQLRTIPNAYSLKKTQLDNLCEELEILCLGSSHAFFGINPVYFSKKAYNAANFSQTLDYDQKILEKYIDKMTLEEKIGQMIQIDRDNCRPGNIKEYFLGSVLSGGGSRPDGVAYTAATYDKWFAFTNNRLLDESLTTNSGSSQPFSYHFLRVSNASFISGCILPYITVPSFASTHEPGYASYADATTSSSLGVASFVIGKATPFGYFT